jgi:hypothetical protein
MNVHERTVTVMNGHEWSETVMNGHERSGSMNGQECSNALELIVENGNGTVTFMFQKRKKHRKNI